MYSNPKLEDLPKEVVQLLKFLVRRNHSLLSRPETLIADASKEIDLSVEQTRVIFYELYKRVFDEFLQEIQKK